MSRTQNLDHFLSSQEDFYTARERSPSSIHSFLSDFSGFSSEGGTPIPHDGLQIPDPSPPISAGPLAPPPTHFPDGNLVSFDSWEAGEKWAQDWAKVHGYAIKRSTGRMKQSRESTKLKKFFICDKGGEERRTNKPEELRKRKRTRSKITGCRFRIAFEQHWPGSPWYLDILFMASYTTRKPSSY
jgi:hypothetical protein